MLTADKQQTFQRLLKMEETLKRNEGSDAPAACKDIKNVKVRKEPKDDGDSEKAVVLVKSTRPSRS